VVDSNGNLVLVLDEGSLHLVELDPPSIDDTINLGIDEIGGMAFTPDESRALFTDADNHVFLLSTDTWATLDTLTLDPTHFLESVDVSISPSGNLAIVANGTDQSLSFVGVSGTQLTRLGLLPIQGVPHQTTFNADGSVAAVSVLSANHIHLIDVASQTITATIEEGMGLGPAGGAIISVEDEPTPQSISKADLDEDGDADAADLQLFAESYGR
jgi:DNA-binding beta-propeller fold protein YncE